jgi:hypothetical protein
LEVSIIKLDFNHKSIVNMDSEFPDYDEEYEMRYADEMEMMMEQGK